MRKHSFIWTIKTGILMSHCLIPWIQANLYEQHFWSMKRDVLVSQRLICNHNFIWTMNHIKMFKKINKISKNHIFIVIFSKGMSFDFEEKKDFWSLTYLQFVYIECQAATLNQHQEFTNSIILFYISHFTN